MKKLLAICLCLCTLFQISAQNNGILFNGVDTRLVIADKPALNISEGYTMEAWIYANSWKSQSWMGSLINKDAQGPDSGFAFRCGANGTLSFVISIDNTWIEAQTPAIMNVEQWHHVAIVVGEGTLTLYIDGEALGNQTFDGEISISTQDLNIGASPGFGDRHFDGIIDELRIWDTARSGADIAANSDVALTGSEDNLVAYFPMNEGTGLLTSSLTDPNCTANFSNMTEDNWVDGFTRPDYDLSLLPLKGIDVLNANTRPIKLLIDIKNLGLKDASGFDVIVSVNGNEIFVETLGVNIASGNQLSYRLKTPVDLTGITDPEIGIRLEYEDDQNTLNNEKSIQITSSEGSVISLFDGTIHNFGADGQNHFNTIILPGDMSPYEQILLHITLECPSGGCDPWDQPAKLSVLNQGSSWEIARYITPYMKACGPWIVDVTDFKDILEGEVTFHSYVQVWGSSGWSVHIDLELVEGNPAFPFSKITPLWTEDYMVYGDPDIEDDLAPASLTIDSNTEANHVRMTISGHGQGNTENAAEFSPKTHHFEIDGASINEHYLWKSDCAINICDDQSGTWTLSRAGWCPGEAVAPYIVNTDLASGTTSTIDYELEEYTNFLNTGYNGSSHTEPHYRLWSYFIENSSSRYKDYNNLVASSIVPTIGGEDENETLDNLVLSFENVGSTPMSSIFVAYFLHGEWHGQETLEITLNPGETYDHTFTNLTGYIAGASNWFVGEVVNFDDENVGDNLVSYFKQGASNIDEIEAFRSKIKVFPNPSSDVANVRFEGGNQGALLHIYNAQGRLIKTSQIKEGVQSISLEDVGLYYFTFINKNGHQFSQPIVIIE